ncbi:hypothetical protein PENTCL1PPCAC_23451, partial [Pristionchus entomophagus]
VHFSFTLYLGTKHTEEAPMEFRRSTRGMTTVDENVRVGVGRANGPMKRTAAAAAEAISKPGMGGRTRGLAVRQTAPNSAVEQPPAKLQKLRAAPLATSRQLHQQQPEVVVRPANGPTSKECELITEDFVGDINEYLFDTEENHLVDELFLSDKKVTAKMRSILVDWIVQVHQRFHLLPETLHLTVYIVDRYLEKANVEKTELQLVGVCAMLAASKYEETYCPELKDFEFITDNAFNKKQMLRMEVGVVKATGFDLGRPHSIQFLRSFSQRAEANASIHCLAKYLSEMCLVDASFSSIKASLIAAGSLWLADHIKGSNLNLKSAFSSVADVEFMKESVKTGKMIASWVLRVRRVGKLRAVTEKYSSSKMYNASNLSAAEEALLEKMVV